MKYKQLHYALKMVLLDVENKYELWKENLREEGILVIDIADKLKNEISLLDIIGEFGVEVLDCLFITKEEKHHQIAKKFGIAVVGCMEEGGETPKTKVLLENLEEVSPSYLNLIFCHANGLPATIAETKHCYIRELTRKDIPILYEILQQKEVARFLSEKLEEKEEIEKLMAYVSYVYSFYEYGYWGVFLKDTGELIGRAGFKEGSWPLEVGYVIKDTLWGQGLATEVLSALLVYGKEELGCEQFLARIQERNKASLNVAKKCGFCSMIEEVREENNNEKTVKVLSAYIK